MSHVVAGNKGSHQVEHQAPLPGRWLRSERDAEDHFSAVQCYEDQADGPGRQNRGGQQHVQVRPWLTGEMQFLGFIMLYLPYVTLSLVLSNLNNLTILSPLRSLSVKYYIKWHLNDPHACRLSD